MTSFKDRLKEGKPLIGTVVTLGVPAVAEVLSNCGFDWLWIDMEHAPLSLEQCQNLILAAGDRCHALVRIPVNDETWIKRVLDLGADGIIVPQVRNAPEAEKAVSASKYPPEGTRSVGIARAHGYGISFATYTQEANEKLAVILQIEHVEGVRNVESIISVPGVDAIVIGPYDLSGSFGKLGQIQDPQVQQAIETVRAACKCEGMPLGIFALLPEQGKAYLDTGYQLLSLGTDVHFLWSAAKFGLEKLGVPKT
jgi:2-dehydro-3-deoxyglucarate aldolase/4-hydroxy-2-oxoheptanedioate aldolase